MIWNNIDCFKEAAEEAPDENRRRFNHDQERIYQEVIRMYHTSGKTMTAAHMWAELDKRLMAYVLAGKEAIIEGLREAITELEDDNHNLECGLNNWAMGEGSVAGGGLKRLRDLVRR
jgi:hypothetical protein